MAPTTPNYRQGVGRGKVTGGLADGADDTDF